MNKWNNRERAETQTESREVIQNDFWDVNQRQQTGNHCKAGDAVQE